MNPPSRYKKPALIGVGLVVALGLGALAFVVAHERPVPGPPEALGPILMASAAPPTEAGPAELALVAPLKKGGKLLDYDITAINGVQRGVMTLVLTKDQAIADLTIALNSLADGGVRAPFVAGPYGIYNSGRRVPPADLNALTNALFEVVKANASVPPPPGLSTLTLDSR